MKRETLKTIWQMGWKITLGCAIFALGFDLFLEPNSLNVGGMSGLATVSYTHLDVYKRQVLREAQRALSSAADAKQAILTDLPALEAAANAELQRQGSGDTARVSFRRELFPTRDYDTFSLPSGVYQSLRVTIGKGEGHNWWCVIFPSLCVPATADGFADAAAAGGFTDAEISLMTRANGAYEMCIRDRPTSARAPPTTTSAARSSATS